MFDLRYSIALLSFWSDRAEFYEDLADAQKRKVLDKTFLERQIANARLLKSPMRVLVLRRLLRHAGEVSLHTLLARVLPKSDRIMLTALNVARDKPTSLMMIARLVRQVQAARRNLLVRLLKPLAIAPLVAILVATLSSAIVQIDAAVPSAAWTGFNAFVRWTAFLCRDHWLALVSFPAMLIGCIAYALPRWVGSARLVADRWVFSLYRDWHAMAVLSSLAALLGSGMLLTTALREVAAHGNRWTGWQVRRILRHLERDPDDVVGALNCGLFSRYVVARFSSLLDAQSGIEAALVELGTTETSRLAQRIDRAAAALSYVLVGILFFVAAVLGVGAITVSFVMADQAAVEATQQAGGGLRRP